MHFSLPENNCCLMLYTDYMRFFMRTVKNWRWRVCADKPAFCCSWLALLPVRQCFPTRWLAGGITLVCQGIAAKYKFLLWIKIPRNKLCLPLEVISRLFLFICFIFWEFFSVVSFHFCAAAAVANALLNVENVAAKTNRNKVCYQETVINLPCFGRILPSALDLSFHLKI